LAHPVSPVAFCTFATTSEPLMSVTPCGGCDGRSPLRTARTTPVSENAFPFVSLRGVRALASQAAAAIIATAAITLNRTLGDYPFPVRTNHGCPHHEASCPDGSR